MATELLFSELKAWLDAQPENTASTPYEIIIKDAPSGGYEGTITRFVYIVGMEMRTGVTSIGGYAFNECSKLSSITIPEGVTSIGSAAFYNCSSLASITIPNSVTSISHGAFNGCSKITSIIIPKNVTSIGDYAFMSCTNLSSVYMAPAFSETLMKSNSFRNTSPDLKLYVSSENPSGWQSAKLTNYGFDSGAAVEVLSTKRWVRIA